MISLMKERGAWTGIYWGRKRTVKVRLDLPWQRKATGFMKWQGKADCVWTGQRRGRLLEGVRDGYTKRADGVCLGERLGLGDGGEARGVGLGQ